MKSSSALEEFLRLCEEYDEHDEGEVDGSGHSIVALSSSDVVSSSTAGSSDVFLSGSGGSSTTVPNSHVDVAGSFSGYTKSTVKETTTGRAHSTPNFPPDDAVGFWIYPDEVPIALKKATLRITAKYLMK
ncbi:hypothetical protein OESDEN_13108 [Oesophagostomum dentatum]|uniref:Uncharacterized protein n=1 Tax=Oesophagostomum dentatum TaxID=61180 RepID=A0A0B1SQD1_OESDE|nr:hypothetical protein OESDEN_13108 [Oesophagostomum dentatum]